MPQSVMNVLHSPPCIIGLSIIGIMVAIASHYARGRIAVLWGAICVLLTPFYAWLAWIALNVPRNPALSYRSRSHSWMVSGVAIGLLVWYGIIEGGWRRARKRRPK